MRRLCKYEATVLNMKRWLSGISVTCFKVFSLTQQKLCLKHQKNIYKKSNFYAVSLLFMEKFGKKFIVKLMSPWPFLKIVSRQFLYQLITECPKFSRLTFKISELKFHFSSYQSCQIITVLCVSWNSYKYFSYQTA